MTELFRVSAEKALGDGRLEEGITGVGADGGVVTNVRAKEKCSLLAVTRRGVEPVVLEKGEAATFSRIRFCKEQS